MPISARSTRARFMFAGIVAMLVALPAGAADKEARDWLLRMNQAVVARNFDGWFTLKVGKHSERLRIIHRMQDGRMSERVITTDGSGREFIRNGTVYVEYMPQSRLARREIRNRSYGFFVALNGLNAESDRLYNIALGGTERLIGRDTQIVLVEPRDGFRYGYRFWLDQQTAMPLKSQVIARTGEVLEESAFIRLSMPESIPDDLLEPDIDTTDPALKTIRADVPFFNPKVKASFRARENLLPAGFRVGLSGAPAVERKDAGPLTRFIVSDGIAWVSVFIDAAERSPGANGQAPDRAGGSVHVLFGALAAGEHYVEGHKVTVVGDVPPAAIKAIAEAFRPE
jgi:sigma-E factor negative regulatory protein RseB